MADPDLQIRGGPDHPDPEIRWGPALKNNFLTLWASIWPKNKVPPPPSGPLRLVPPLQHEITVQ